LKYFIVFILLFSTILYFFYLLFSFISFGSFFGQLREPKFFLHFYVFFLIFFFFLLAL